MNYKQKRSLLFAGLPFFFFMAATVHSANGQTTKANPKTEAAEAKVNGITAEKPAAPGTYQFLAKDAASHEIFPYEILLEIERNRKEDEMVFLKAGKSTVIKIPSYKEIRSKNFKPLAETGLQQ